MRQTQKEYTRGAYMNALDQRVLIFDGAMGTSLQALNLQDADFGGKQQAGCNDCLVLSSPQSIEAVHTAFLEVGADVIETNTFRANRLTLADYGMADRTLEINQKAAALARRLADQYSTAEKPRFVAGSIGPSGKLISTDDPQMSDITFEALAEVFCEQAVGLIQGGVDLLLIETSQDILEVKAAITGILQAFEETGERLPIQAQVTLDVTGRMLLGTDISATLAILEGMPIAVIGLNCSTGPEYMRQPIKYLGENAALPISCIPNAGLPLNVNGEAVYPMKPEPFADQLSEFVSKFGVRVVGGCCGTTPEHIRLLVEKIGNGPVEKKSITRTAWLSSAVEAVSMQQEPAPFLIGERLNAQGSRKFKECLMAEDYDGLVEIAREQVASGAHGLDVCVALTERSDESMLMQKLVKRLSLEVPVPLIIDATEPDVLEAALKTVPGRSLINSTNLESGEEKARRVMGLAKKYNAALMMLTIDEKGMAKTAERKLAVAERFYNLAVNDFQMGPQDLVFDVLTFTLATGDTEYALSAVETLNGIKKVKEKIPGVLTSLGVSNVSFGLSSSARKVINSVFLYHAVKAGLDMALVNVAQIKPYAEIDAKERELAEDLIFNRHEAALSRLIAHFETVKEITLGGKRSEDDLEGLPVEERLKQRILRRIKAGVENDIEEIFEGDLLTSRSDKAVMILNTVLLPAMKEVGDKFGAGELILPFVLQSAEVMKKAVAYLENFLEHKEGISKGKLVLATVYGDVHDIGKNLVKTILSNNGYSVVDLGKQVPAETIISRAIEEKADAIGLSALLVSTSKQMPLIVNELARRKIALPVLIGGAAINPRFGWHILKTEDGEYYEPGVFYCKDAFEGLSTMDALSEPEQREKLLADVRAKADHEHGIVRKMAVPADSSTIRSNLKLADFIPEAPFWGVRVVEAMPLTIVAQHLSNNELFRLSWGAKNTHGAAWEKLESEFNLRLERMLKDAAQNKWLEPKAVYGYWPAQAAGNDLVLFDPNTLEHGEPMEVERFTFPRQSGGENLSLADYFLPIGSAQMDVVALQVVTVGEVPTLRFAEMEATGDFSEAYFLHGLAVQMAEATAAYMHTHIRRELNLPEDQGLRYSWGYPAIPELSDHEKVFRLLPAGDALGMHLTSAYQLVPEQSTAAIIVHHPAAKYFNVGVNRLDQLLG
jgi:5-methyltetrahydrofolate--homocysteine methyltransferase